METTIRKLVRATSWHITGVFAVFIISWILTGSAILAITIAITEAIARFLLYWLHEWAWNRSSWGKNIPRLSKF